MLKRKKLGLFTFVLLLILLLGCLVYYKGLCGFRGVYYPPIDKDILSTTVSPMISSTYGTSYLYYDGSIYTTSKGEYNIIGDDLKQENYITDVYVYHSFLSTEPEILAGTTYKGDLYSVEGYDKEFRVAVYYQDYNTIILYNKLNDIWLKEGKELFSDMLHLDNPKSITIEKWGKSETRKELSDDEMEAFMDSLFNSKFVENNDISQQYINDSTDIIKVRVVRKDGSAEVLQLYDNGYAEFDALSTDIVINISGTIVLNIIDEFD